MNLLRRSLLVTALATLLWTPMAAQGGRPTPVLTPTITTPYTGAASTLRLVLRVTLPEGLHVQANKPRDPNLIPTVLTLEAPAGTSVVDVTYPKPIDFSLTGSKQPLAVYPHEFEIAVRLKVPAGLAAGTQVPATLRYQACNDALCFPPARAQASWTLAAATR